MAKLKRSFLPRGSPKLLLFGHQCPGEDSRWFLQWQLSCSRLQSQSTGCQGAWQSVTPLEQLYEAVGAVLTSKDFIRTVSLFFRRILESSGGLIGVMHLFSWEFQRWNRHGMYDQNSVGSFWGVITLRNGKPRSVCFLPSTNCNT